MKDVTYYLQNPVNINIARGFPNKELLDLSNGIFDVFSSKSDYHCSTGYDVRNYGLFDGIDDCKRLFSEILNTSKDNIFVGGVSSSQLMFNLISKSFTHGVCGSTPWSKLKEIKWICIVPGYDRHFNTTGYFNIKMINVPLKNGDPDMDLIEELIKDDSVKGIWCVPQYSNPTGDTYSKKCLERFAKLKPAAKDFRIYWDNAYAVHYIDKYEPIDDIVSLCDKYGNPDLVYEFASTSKITFAGGGVSCLATSKNNLEDVKPYFFKIAICNDKVNQLRHARFFPNKEVLLKHMDKHAAIIKKHIDAFDEVFSKNIKGLASWNKPKGGYFICLKVDGKAKEVTELCGKCGLTLTEAGCAFPYHNDPENAYIRIAMTNLEYEQCFIAAEVICAVIKELSK